MTAAAPIDAAQIIDSTRNLISPLAISGHLKSIVTNSPYCGQNRRG